MAVTILLEEVVIRSAHQALSTYGKYLIDMASCSRRKYQTRPGASGDINKSF